MDPGVPPKNVGCRGILFEFAGKAVPQRAIRAIYGSVANEKAPHLHADPCQARVPAAEVAQVHLVEQLPLQNLDVHFSIGEILRFIMVHSCHRQFFGGTPVRWM